MRRLCPLLLVLARSLFGQESVVHEGSPGLLFSNGAVELVVLSGGGSFASFVLEEDAQRVNLLWDPARMARERGSKEGFGPSKGHFLCVDGFGPVTAAERAAGLADHGEANKLPWETVESTAASATFRVRLPLVQEKLTRRIRMAPGETVVLVQSELESEISFDRVVLWAEHATLGAPFLSLGKTVVDQSARHCQTKPHDGKGRSVFPSGQNFEWPDLPGRASLRVSPARAGVFEHIGCLMDPGREDEFITAIDTERGLLVGYLFPRRDFAWVQHWMHYPEDGSYAWGLEFGMQPYDMTKEEIAALTPMFDTPTFRWLPAKSKLATKFLMFATRVPPGFDRVDDVRLEKGKVILTNESKAIRLTLDYSGEW
jgi:hypothetical protein